MKKGFGIAIGLALLAAIAIAALLILRPSGEEPEHSAAVIETVNKVDANPHPKDDWRPAVVNMLIYGGGRVRTGAASSARLQLLEGIVRLSADTLFTVKKSASRQGRLETTVSLQEGRLWAHLTPDQPHDFSVETAHAVATVRDTRFSVKASEDGTLVSVAEGEVRLTAQEQSVTVAAGQQATVEPDQPPSPPEPMGGEERELWASEGEVPALAPPPLTPSPTQTPLPMPTRTELSVPTLTAMPTATSTPEPTHTSIPTSIPPTATWTPEPTPTLVPPTATPMSTPSPTVPSEVQVDMEDNGRQIELAVGQALVVTLGSNPSTGYEWEVAEVERTVLQQIGEKEFQRDPNAPANTVGAGGFELFRFEALTAGRTALKLIYRRPWEAEVEPLETYSLQVSVR
jgi:inhibitor of cysteine peptidase